MEYIEGEVQLEAAQKDTTKNSYYLHRNKNSTYDGI